MPGSFNEWTSSRVPRAISSLPAPARSVFPIDTPDDDTELPSGRAAQQMAVLRCAVPCRAVLRACFSKHAMGQTALHVAVGLLGSGAEDHLTLSSRCDWLGCWPRDTIASTSWQLSLSTGHWV